MRHTLWEVTEVVEKNPTFSFVIKSLAALYVVTIKGDHVRGWHSVTWSHYEANAYLQKPLTILTVWLNIVLIIIHEQYIRIYI